jgi:hypothetical protein
MIVALTKNKPMLRTLLILGVTSVTTLILVIGLVVLHIPGFSPLASAHAPQHQSTCATTSGTLLNLCDQQDPIVQGCAQDAQSIESVFAYHQGTLIGEVDLRHSTLCNTYWVRTIAYASAIPPVNAIDAYITFTNGSVSDSGQIALQSGQPATVYTEMAYQHFSMSTNQYGTFHLTGTASPITISL